MGLPASVAEECGDMQSNNHIQACQVVIAAGCT